MMLPLPRRFSTHQEVWGKLWGLAGWIKITNLTTNG